MMRQPPGLTPDDQRALREGQHERLAADLLARQRPDLAAWVREQIWDWAGAFTAYLTADRPYDALRVALESGAAAHLDQALARLEQVDDPRVLDEAVRLLERRRLPHEAARLLARRDDPLARAEALLQAGERLEAARCLAEAGHPRRALDVLGEEPALVELDALRLATRLAWDLGDAEGAARYAQRVLREGGGDEDIRTLLARALVALGHDVAAQIALRGRPLEVSQTAVPGRYHVDGIGPVGLVGTAYVGVDRVTLQEVEIHLLLAEVGDGNLVEHEIGEALERFAAAAESGARIGHPAIRPVLRLDPEAGLLVMPRAEGLNLRQLIRPPGMATMPSRARALVAFLVEGLTAGHARGLVHGWLLPSQIVCDAAGRPMLPPFGAHHLAGLAATRTGSLEEIMAVTAPEIRRGEPPTVQSDAYAVGALLRALLAGRLSGSRDEGVLPGAEFELAEALMHPDPHLRTPLEEVLWTLRDPIPDLRELEAPHRVDPARPLPRESGEPDAAPGLRVAAAASWSDDLLQALCEHANPWMQPILDRSERVLVLAPWPEGCRGLADEVSAWDDLLETEAWTVEHDGLAQALRDRMAPSAMVRTPAGEWMIALDDLLQR